MTESKKENGPELGDRIAKLAAQITVGEHALITAIGTFDDSGQWARGGRDVVRALALLADRDES